MNIDLLINQIKFKFIIEDSLQNMPFPSLQTRLISLPTSQMRCVLARMAHRTPRHADAFANNIDGSACTTKSAESFSQTRNDAPRIGRDCGGVGDGVDDDDDGVVSGTI